MTSYGRFNDPRHCRLLRAKASELSARRPSIVAICVCSFLYFLLCENIFLVKSHVDVAMQMWARLA